MLRSLIVAQAVLFGGAMCAHGADTLLDLDPSLPIISYDNQGTTTYDASSGLFSIDARAIRVLVAPGLPPALIREDSVENSRAVRVRIFVDNAGNLIGGDPSGPDFVVRGRVDVDGDGFDDFDGLLLQGEVLEFGSKNGDGFTDFFDYRFDITGGFLAAFYGGQHIYVQTTSETSSFADDFTTNFGGEAKGDIGPVPALTPGGNGEDCCENGRPVVLTFRYTGDGCEATAHNQDPDKVVCLGDPNDASAVFIRVTDKSNPMDNSGDIFFEGNVLRGLTFQASAIAAGDDFSSETFIHIFEANSNNLLQTVKFHTSCSQPLEVGYQFGASLLVGCVGEDEPIAGDCCNFGRPRQITLRYTGFNCDATSHGQDDDKVNCEGDPMGATDVVIRVSNKENPTDTKAKVYFQGPVQLGNAFDVHASAVGRDEFESKTFVHIFDALTGDLLQSIEFHTSCSQPLRIGDRFGGVALVNCIGRDEPVPGDCCADGDRPRALVIEYTGGSCDDSANMQAQDKVFCEGDTMDAPSVLVRASNKGDANDTGARVYFEGEVALNGTFEMQSLRAGQDHFDSNSWIHFFDATTGELLQTLKFHTSCSQPLAEGDAFGAALIVGCTGEDEPFPGDCCDDGNRPASLVFRYTGNDCSASDNFQGPDKFNCDGDPMGESRVTVRVSDDEDPNDSGAKIWFLGEVDIDTTFEASAFNAGEDRFSSATFIHVFDLSGNLLQSVEFHTSCSQPLALGNVFGAFILEECSPEGGVDGNDLCTNGRPQGITVEYTAESCAATVHFQDPSKVTCTDYSANPLPSMVTIRVSNKANENDTGAKVYFQDVVDAASAAVFNIDAAVVGDSGLSSESFIHVFDMSGNLLQFLRFHTSCSQPLGVGNQFGSIHILGLVNNNSPSDFNINIGTTTPATPATRPTFDSIRTR